MYLSVSGTENISRTYLSLKFLFAIPISLLLLVKFTQTDRFHANTTSLLLTLYNKHYFFQEIHKKSRAFNV